MQLPESSILNFDRNFDLPNQQIIKLDVERTRTSVFTKLESYNLELLLSHYCKSKKTSYTQGMNEIMAPFILMMRDGISLQQAYCLFDNFIDLALPKMFGTVIVIQDFKPLHALFVVFKLLLRYHEPEISAHLHNHGISPELFSTS